MNVQPKKTIGAGELGALSCGELENIQMISLLISFTAQLVGSSSLGDLWLGSTFSWPSLSEIPRCPAAWSGETHPALGVWSEPSELSGTEISGGAGCGALQDVSTITEPMQTALSTDWSLLHTLLHPCCRDSLFLRLSLVSARQKECLTLSAQDSAGNKTQSTF